MRMQPVIKSPPRKGLPSEQAELSVEGESKEEVADR